MSESPVEIVQHGSDAVGDVAVILLGRRASRRQSSRLSRVTRASALTPMAAVLAGSLATEIAKLGAARAFNVVASFGKLNRARAVGTKLELGAALVRREHLLLVFLLGLAGFLAAMVDDISDVLELGGAVEAAETLAVGVRAGFDGDVLFAFTVDDETADELAAGAKDAFVWEGGVLDSLELVLLEQSRVEMVGIVEDSPVAELDGVPVFILDDSSDQDSQTLEADAFSMVDYRRLSFWLVFIADRAYVRILRDRRGGRHGGCCWLFAGCCV